jgi:hypothetical protein
LHIYPSSFLGKHACTAFHFLTVCTFGSDSGGVVSLLLRLCLYRVWLWSRDGNERRPGAGLACFGLLYSFFVVVFTQQLSIDRYVLFSDAMVPSYKRGRIYLLFFARSS